jgi:hypothetical protein
MYQARQKFLQWTQRSAVIELYLTPADLHGIVVLCWYPVLVFIQHDNERLTSQNVPRYACDFDNNNKNVCGMTWNARQDKPSTNDMKNSAIHELYTSGASDMDCSCNCISKQRDHSPKTENLLFYSLSSETERWPDFEVLLVMQESVEKRFENCFRSVVVRSALFQKSENIVGENELASLRFKNQQIWRSRKAKEAQRTT